MKKEDISFVQSYLDSDVEEIFYSLAFTYNSKGDPILIVAGFRGILKCINCLTFELESILVGHGNAVNDIKIHPLLDFIVFSASKDESIRMFNIETAVCVGIFAGDKGHRDEVLHIDIHPRGISLVSSGMDTSIKIWNLCSPELVDNIKKSKSHYAHIEKVAFKPVIEQSPVYSTNLVHSDYTGNNIIFS